MSDKSSCRTRKFVQLGWVLLVVLPLLCLVVLRFHLVQAVDERLEAIRAAGLPTDGEELNQWYAAVPEDQNAAVFITQAVGLLQNFDSTNSHYREFSDFKTPPPGQPLDIKQRRLLSDYVAMNAAALAKARQAALLPKSRYPLDFRQGFDTPMPHLRHRDLARIEEYTALLALGTSRSNQAIASITSILDLARTLEDEPILVSQLVRNGVLTCAKETLERSLALSSFGKADLARLQDAFSTSEKTNLLARSLIEYQALCLPIFRTNTTEIERMRRMVEEGWLKTGALPLTGPRAWKYRALQWFDRDLSLFLDAMETNIAIAKLPPPRSLAIKSNF